MDEQDDPTLSKVLVRRWPDYYTLIGPPAQIMDIEEISVDLAQSPFMTHWVANKIVEALRAGEVFQRIKPPSRFDDGPTWKGRPDRVTSEYRLVTREELGTVVDRSAEVVHPGTRSHSTASGSYTLKYKSDEDLTEKYRHLPPQARTILDVLSESGRSEFSEESLMALLEEKKDRLNTKQPAMAIFKYYKKRLIGEGHLVQ